MSCHSKDITKIFWAYSFCNAEPMPRTASSFLKGRVVQLSQVESDSMRLYIRSTNRAAIRTYQPLLAPNRRTYVVAQPELLVDISLGTGILVGCLNF